MRTLKCLDRLQQHRFARWTALAKKGSERQQCGRTDPAIDRQIGVIAAVAVKGIQGPLQKTDGGGCAHVNAGIEQFCGQFGRKVGDLVEGGSQPV